MRKYLELFRQGFDSTVEEKRSLENWPYVGHDVLSGEVVYTEIYKPVILKNCEVWYTTSDGEINPFNDNYCNAKLISNTYENGLGIAVFDSDITHIWASYNVLSDMSGFLESFIGYILVPLDEESGDIVASSNLTSIILPDSLETIDELSLCYTHSNLSLGRVAPKSNLKEITLSKNVKTIKGNFFDLDKVNYKGTAEDWSKINLLHNYYDESKIDAEYLKHFNGVVSGNADPSIGAELVFI